MKHLSFKLKTTILITALITAVCAVSIAALTAAGLSVADSETQQTLIKTVERNVDEIEYKNGILEVESDFSFYTNGVYCDVYNENFEYIDGETPHTLIQTSDFENGNIRKHTIDGKEYYIYDSKLEFLKHEYEIDVFSGQIISYESDSAAAQEIKSAEYSVISFAGGINTEQAIEIALEHAGASRENVEILTAEIPSYSDRQVFKIEFSSSEQLAESVWIRGIVPVSAASGAYSTLTKAALYVIPAFIIISAIGAYVISKRTIRPIEKITKSAQEISSGSDLTKRIELSTGKDEIYTLAETFNEMFERLQTSFESEKQFTSDASHELRTPLAVIKAECDFALSDMANAEDKEEALVSVSEQTEKMTRLVNALLSLTRTEQGTQRFNFEDADLSTLVEEICSDYKTDKGIKINADIQSGISMNMDVSLISRLLENLLSNAVRYGRENGYINVSLSKKENNIILSVKDNGIGIKEEDLQKIWGRFYRTDSSRSNSEGFGLGLALVERIAALHAGKCGVKSVYGEGSEFEIVF